MGSASVFPKADKRQKRTVVTREWSQGPVMQRHAFRLPFRHSLSHARNWQAHAPNLSQLPTHEEKPSTGIVISNGHGPSDSPAEKPPCATHCRNRQGFLQQCLISCDNGKQGSGWYENKQQKDKITVFHKIAVAFHMLASHGPTLSDLFPTTTPSPFIPSFSSSTIHPPDTFFLLLIPKSLKLPFSRITCCDQDIPIVAPPLLVTTTFAHLTLYETATHHASRRKQPHRQWHEFNLQNPDRTLRPHPSSL
jgi:hypothetical protein